MAAVYDKYTHVNNGQNKFLGDIRPEILKKRFLELYPNTGSISKTCSLLGMVPRTFYHWKRDDPEFYLEFIKADEEALGLLEDAAHLRAVYGIDKPVYQRGLLVGYIKEYSDTLLIVLLKARAPHKYKERFSGELTGADGKPLNNELKIIHVHSNIPLAQSEDEIQKDYISYEDIPKLGLKPKELPKTNLNEFDDLM